MESRERNRYLLAKAHFDCREFERCAAVFLPATQPRTPLTVKRTTTETGGNSEKNKAKARGSTGDRNFRGPYATSTQPVADQLPRLSQKSLFLALYARYLAGEKRRDEESEMILGPADKGSAVNRELLGITEILESYFGPKQNLKQGGGWLEYLFGVVLAKGKNAKGANITYTDRKVRHWAST